MRGGDLPSWWPHAQSLFGGSVTAAESNKQAWHTATWCAAAVSAVASGGVVIGLTREVRAHGGTAQVDTFWLALRQLAAADLLGSIAWLVLRPPWRAGPIGGCVVAMPAEEVCFFAAWLLASLLAATHVARCTTGGGHAALPPANASGHSTDRGAGGPRRGAADEPGGSGGGGSGARPGDDGAASLTVARPAPPPASPPWSWHAVLRALCSCGAPWLLAAALCGTAHIFDAERDALESTPYMCDDHKHVMEFVQLSVFFGCLVFNVAVFAHAARVLRRDAMASHSNFANATANSHGGLSPRVVAPRVAARVALRTLAYVGAFLVAALPRAVGYIMTIAGHDNLALARVALLVAYSHGAINAVVYYARSPRHYCASKRAALSSRCCGGLCGGGVSHASAAAAAAALAAAAPGAVCRFVDSEDDDEGDEGAEDGAAGDERNRSNNTEPSSFDDVEGGGADPTAPLRSWGAAAGGSSDTRPTRLRAPADVVRFNDAVDVVRLPPLDAPRKHDSGGGGGRRGAGDFIAMDDSDAASSRDASRSTVDTAAAAAAAADEAVAATAPVPSSLGDGDDADASAARAAADGDAVSRWLRRPPKHAPTSMEDEYAALPGGDDDCGARPCAATGQQAARGEAHGS